MSLLSDLFELVDIASAEQQRSAHGYERARHFRDRIAVATTLREREHCEEMCIVWMGLAKAASANARAGLFTLVEYGS